MAGSDVTLRVDADTRPLMSSIKKSLSGYSRPLGKISGELGEFEKSLAASNARVLAFGASASAIFAVQRAISETVKATINLEKQLAEINVILGTSNKQLLKFGNELFNIARNTGQSFNTVAEGAKELARQGLGLAESLKRTNDALILSRLTGLSAADSVNTLTAALNGFTKAALDSTAVTNKIIAVDQAFAVSGADLAEALKRVGSTAATAGVSLDELLGIVTAAQQITARGGAVIGNSFKTIFTRLQRPRTIEALEQLGIATKDASGTLLPVIQILNNLAKQFDGLAQSQQSQIAQLVGGVFQINVLKAALQDLGREYSVFGRATEISANASDEAARRNAELNKTLSAQLNALVQNINRVAAVIGKLTLEPALERVVGTLNKLLGTFDVSESDGLGARIGSGILSGLGNFLSGPGLAIAGASLIKLFQFMTTQARDALATIMKMGTATGQRAQAQEAVNAALMKDEALTEQILAGTISTADAVRRVKEQIVQATAAQERFNSVARAAVVAGVRQNASGALVVGGRAGRASGFIPNFAKPEFEAERKMAISLGAPKSVRPMMSRGTIGGRKFVMNNKEVEIPNFGKNGDSAVIPSYSSGFIPNFGRPPSALQAALAKGDTTQISNALTGLSQKAATGTVTGRTSFPFANLDPKVQAIFTKKYGDDFGRSSAAREAKRKKAKKDQKRFTHSFNNKIGIFTTGASMSTRGHVDFTRGQLAKMSGVSIKRLQEMGVQKGAGALKGTNIFQSQTALASGELGSNPTFDNIVETRLKQPMANIVSDLIGGSPDGKDIPSPVDVWKKASQDTSGYPQFVGRVFEAAINAVLNKVPPKNANWDYKGKDFNVPKGQDALYKALFGGSLEQMQGARYVDAKRSGFGETATRESIAKKIGNTKQYREQIRKKIGIAALGYIPNFANSIQEAMDAEEKMISGSNKAKVGYDPRVGLMVYNQRQGNPRRAISQHLMGGDKFSSLKTMGMSTRATGFIPNFAEETPEEKANRKKQETKDRKESQRQNRLMMASFAISMGGGALAETLAKGNDQLKGDINNFTSNLGMAAAAAGMIPGPMGAVVGGAVAAYSALNYFAKRANTQGEDFITAAQGTKEEFQALQDSVGQYASTLQQMSDLLKANSPDGEAMVRLENKLVEIAIELPASFRSLISATNDTSALQRKLAEELEKQRREAEGTTNAAGFQDTANKFFRGELSGNELFGGPSADSKLRTKGAISDIRGGFETQDFQRLMSDLKNGLVSLDGPAATVVARLRDQYNLNDDMAMVMLDLAGRGEHGKEALRNLLGALEDDTRERGRNADAARQFTAAAQAAAAAQNQAQQGLNMAQTFANILAKIRNIRLTEVANLITELGKTSREIGTARAEGAIKSASPFMTDEQQAGLEFTMEISKLKDSQIDGLNKAKTGIAQSYVDGVKDLLSGKGFGGLLDVLEQSFAATGNVEGAIALVNNLIQNGNLSQQEQAQLLGLSNAALAELGVEIRQGNRDYARGVEIARLAYEAQKKLLQIQKDQTVMGGIDAFLDPTKTDKILTSISDSIKLFVTASKRGDQVQRGRGLGQLARTFQQNLGMGALDPQGSTRQAIVGAREAELKGNFAAIEQQLMQAFAETNDPAILEMLKAVRDSQARVGEIAQHQVDAEYKLAKIPQETLSEIQSLRNDQAQQSEDQITAITAISTAVQNLGQEKFPSLQNAINNLSQFFNQQIYNLRAGTGQRGLIIRLLTNMPRTLQTAFSQALGPLLVRPQLEAAQGEKDRINQRIQEIEEKRRERQAKIRGDIGTGTGQSLYSNIASQPGQIDASFNGEFEVKKGSGLDDLIKLMADQSGMSEQTYLSQFGMDREYGISGGDINVGGDGKGIQRMFEAQMNDIGNSLLNLTGTTQGKQMLERYGMFNAQTGQFDFSNLSNLDAREFGALVGMGGGNQMVAQQMHQQLQMGGQGGVLDTSIEEMLNQGANKNTAAEIAELASLNSQLGVVNQQIQNYTNQLVSFNTLFNQAVNGLQGVVDAAGNIVTQMPTTVIDTNTGLPTTLPAGTAIPAGQIDPNSPNIPTMNPNAPLPVPITGPINDMAEDATEPGSIYVHDIHTEEILNKMLVLDQQRNEILLAMNEKVNALQQLLITANVQREAYGNQMANAAQSLGRVGRVADNASLVMQNIRSGLNAQGRSGSLRGVNPTHKLPNPNSLRAH